MTSKLNDFRDKYNPAQFYPSVENKNEAFFCYELTFIPEHLPEVIICMQMHSISVPAE